MNTHNGEINGKSKNADDSKTPDTPLWWQMLIPSLIGISLLIAAPWFIDERFENLSILLVTVSIVPWFAPLFKKIKLGPIEAEIRETAQAVRKLEQRNKQFVSHFNDDQEDLRESLMSAIGENLLTAEFRRSIHTQGLNDPKSKTASPQTTPQNEREIFKEILTEYEFKHLLNLRPTAPKESYENIPGTVRNELERLLSLGLIRRKPSRGIRTLYRESGRGNDIRNHFELSAVGEKVIAAGG